MLTKGRLVGIGRGATVVVVAALVLTGCSGGDGGQAASSSTSSPRGPDAIAPTSAASTPTGSSTQPPGAARADTKAGAEAFARWYYEQIGEQTHTGSGEVTRAHSLETCNVCQIVAKKQDAKGESGLLSKENPYRVAPRSSRVEAGVRYVTLDVSFDDYYLFDSSGTKKARVAAEEFEVVMAVDRDANRWAVAGWWVMK